MLQRGRPGLKRSAGCTGCCFNLLEGSLRALGEVLAIGWINYGKGHTGSSGEMPVDQQLESEGIGGRHGGVSAEGGKCVQEPFEPLGIPETSCIQSNYPHGALLGSVEAPCEQSVAAHAALAIGQRGGVIKCLPLPIQTLVLILLGFLPVLLQAPSLALSLVIMSQAHYVCMRPAALFSDLCRHCRRLRHRILPQKSVRYCHHPQTRIC